MPTFADAIQCGHKDCKNKHAVITAIILLTQHPHYLQLSIIEHSVLMAFTFYYKDMLEKIKTQRIQQFSAFCVTKIAF